MLKATIDEKYRILRLLGEGGMGCVYEAVRVEDGSHVALKLINNSHPSDSELSRFQREAKAVSLAQFQREVTAVSAVDTEHIVRMLDSGKDPKSNAPYLVMELLAGESLQQLLDRTGPLEPDTVLRIAAQVCRGLGQAHAAGVIHRDIKPANLFLARGEAGEIVVKIVDFGIAKIRKELMSTGLSTSLTAAGGLIGTVAYMSPEQAQDSKKIDFRTDLWSLGVVLYRALSGKVPHHDIELLNDLILAICRQPPRSLLEKDVAPWVPQEVAAVVHCALRLDPVFRFATATEMLDTISPLLPNGPDDFALHEDMLIPAKKAHAPVQTRPPPAPTIPGFDVPTVKAVIAAQ